MIPILSRLSGNGLFARALRGSAFVAAGYFASQALRLAANLVLTRILFPDAFGLMALITVFLVGLTMFSDMGIGPSIAQHRRGDDPAFLDTAWTLQLIRGGVLWLVACALALPVAIFYSVPELAQMLPVAALTLVISGFNPTRIETANRHLLLGRLTLLDLVSQVVGIAVSVVFAWLTGSVWALVAGGVVAAAVRLALTSVLLPGRGNRPFLERDAANDLIRFGVWIFLSTACGFLLSQGDKAILGWYLTLENLGIYNIGFFLASFPLLLGGAITGRVLIPLYRETAGGDALVTRRLRRMRFALSGGLVSLLAVFALSGVWLIDLMYDSRYALAGGIVVLIACVQMPQVIGLSYDQAALAAGDSRNFFFVMALRAAGQTLAFLVGVQVAGLGGALVAQGLALIAMHGAIIWLARRHGVWDPVHDIVFTILAFAAATVGLWLNLAAVSAIFVL